MFSSCSQVVSKDKPQNKILLKTNLDLVKDIEQERWNQNKLLSYFGIPKETLTDSKNKLN
jgi:hypothetical protein